MNSLVDTMEGFFDNVSHSPNIDKITKLFNDWIETEDEWSFVRSSTFTHYVPKPCFEFNPKKFTFSIYSNIFKNIRYDIQISDFIKDVMDCTDDDNSYIFCRYTINEDKLVLNIQLEYDGPGSNKVIKRYTLKLIPSLFAKIRNTFDRRGWFLDAMDHLETNDPNDRSKYKVEDIKKAIKEIYDLF